MLQAVARGIEISLGAAMLFTIGLRIERLLYLVFFLILICALQVYLTAAAAHFNAAETKTLDALINVFEGKKEELDELFRKSQTPSVAATERELRVAAMREKMGLAPAINSSGEDQSKYREKLSDLTLSVPNWYEIRAEVSGKINAKKSPEEIISLLTDLRRSKTQERGTVMGVETPRLLTVQYGSADFRLSAQPLATGLLAALYPLSFVWLGSFYITRQRELIGIRALNDYKQAFPHILNVFAVDFARLNAALGFETGKKSNKQTMMMVRFLATSLRTAFLLITIAPLIIGLGYSTYTLLELVEPPMPINLLAMFGYFSLVILALILLMQELIALKGKIFYE